MPDPIRAQNLPVDPAQDLASSAVDLARIGAEDPSVTARDAVVDVGDALRDGSISLAAGAREGASLDRLWSPSPDDDLQLVRDNLRDTLASVREFLGEVVAKLERLDVEGAGELGTIVRAIVERLEGVSQGLAAKLESGVELDEGELQEVAEAVAKGLERMSQAVSDAYQNTRESGRGTLDAAWTRSPEDWMAQIEQLRAGVLA